MEFKEIVSNLPDKPGCYLFKDKSGEIIYIGKAISLKKRVSSYFQKSLNFDSSPKTELLVNDISDIEYIITDSEFEALLKEYELIKNYRPKYNRMYKDDKSYPYLHITDNEEYPRILVERLFKDEIKEEGAYIGPFLVRKNLDIALDTIAKIFPFCNCKKPCKQQKRACLRFQYKKCPGPCVGAISKENYREQIENIRLFLEGHKEELLKKLLEQMTTASKNLDFEKAAKIRDQIQGIEKTIKNIHFTSEPEVESVQSVTELQKALKLPKPPLRIAGFDIGGSDTGISSGSLVIFENGIPKKEEYRRFKIRTVGPNDYSMMQELIERRYSRILKENEKLPDLILIDGGLGQVNAAYEILTKLNIQNQPIIGIAKKEELIFKPKESKPIKLSRNSKALWLLQRIRDEAHRFAIAYHKKLRSKSTLTSILDNIPGIGEKRRNALLEHFGSINKIKNASIEELQEVKFISRNIAENIKTYFKENK
ncbi:MAG: excinuclease ABC subunit UvrC [Candidatus Lokiarchaeota archaeon]|nr:excinuclease ABC subunit UvrC [Candidatus Lokiarchaeota archaeon]